MSHVIDERGNRHGDLLVLTRDHRKHGTDTSAYWWCRCRMCGKRVSVRGASFRGRKVKSHGHCPGKPRNVRHWMRHEVSPGVFAKVPAVWVARANGVSSEAFRYRIWSGKTVREAVQP